MRLLKAGESAGVKSRSCKVISRRGPVSLYHGYMVGALHTSPPDRRWMAPRIDSTELDVYSKTIRLYKSQGRQRAHKAPVQTLVSARMI